MRAKDVRSLTADQMLEKEKQYKEKLFNSHFQQTTGQLENTARLRQVHKSIARIKTVLGEEALRQN